MKRIDVLGPDSQHLRAISPRHLLGVTDDELQRVVTEAARELGCPMALVTMLLEDIQFFKAHYGLPGDLAAARATDRDVSFCQFVVRDGQPFEVNHAAEDARVPQELVERYDIQAYLGIPVVTSGVVVGSLCVIDTQPRQFDARDRATLTRLAAVVSRRLNALATESHLPSSALTAQVALPAFAELRNLLMPLSFDLWTTSLYTAELAPALRLAHDTLARDPATEGARGVLESAMTTLDDLNDLSQSLEQVRERLEQLLFALQAGIVYNSRPIDVGEALAHGLTLSEHLVRNIGGLHVEGEDTRPLRTATAVAVMAVGAILKMLADATPLSREPSGLRARIDSAEEHVTVTMSSPDLSPAQHAALFDHLQVWVDASKLIELELDEGALALHLPVATSATS